MREMDSISTFYHLFNLGKEVERQGLLYEELEISFNFQLDDIQVSFV